MKTLMTISLMMLLTACAKVNFDTQSGSSLPTKNADDASGTLTQGNTPGTNPPTGTPSSPPVDLNSYGVPKIRFIGPPCQRQTDCAITFELDRTYPAALDFDWQTNDRLFGTPAQSGLPPWGKPGLPGDASAQYVPTQGHLTFAPGEKSITVHVPNINQQNTAISIGVLMSACVYNKLAQSCKDLFAQ